MSYYIDFGSENRKNAIEDLQRHGLHWVEVLRIENQLAHLGLNSHQRGDVLTVVAMAIRNSRERQLNEQQTKQVW